MHKVRSALRQWDFWAILSLFLWPCVYFADIALGRGVWYSTDIIRLFHPFGVELGRALADGRLPLWTPGLSAGFPLFAESQVGAAYPPNLFLFRLLAAHYAISYSLLLHMGWAGCGMFLYVRSAQLKTVSAWLAGFVFEFNGFVLSQIIHPPIISAMAWLPWLLLFQDRFQRSIENRNRREGLKWLVACAFAIGLNYLTGSIQIAFFNTVAFVTIGIAGRLIWNRPTSPDEPTLVQGSSIHGWARTITKKWSKSIVQAAFWTALPVVLGLGVAAVQLVPTFELVGYSVRSGQIGDAFATSYSLPPAFLSQFLLPYAQGEPSEGNNEFWGYIGITGFVFAACAPFLRKNGRTLFFAVFAVVALALTLGEVNPLYRAITGLPVLNSFRVPARYLLFFDMACAFLAATAFEEMASRLLASAQFTKRQGAWIAGLALVIASVMAVAHIQPPEFWLEAWRYLPVAFGIGASLLIGLAVARKMSYKVLATAAMGLVVADLAAYAPPFELIDWVNSPSYVEAAPRSLAILKGAGANGRVFTDLSEFPSIPSLRGSLFENTALSFDAPGAQVYSSLALSRHETYVADPSPAMLDLLNVQFYAIPLDPRPLSRTTTPGPEIASVLGGDPIAIPPTRTSTLEISSYTEQAADVPIGTTLAEIHVQFKDGSDKSFPIRMGIETADWDYLRLGANADVRAVAAHSFPAFWRSYGKPFDGQTYTARHQLPAESVVVSLDLRSLLPDIRLVIERVLLVASDGATIPLAKLGGKVDFTLAYMSDTVAIWKNLDVLSRAFIVHESQVADDSSSLALLQNSEFQPKQTVILNEAAPLAPKDRMGTSIDSAEIIENAADRVIVRVSANGPGFLFLSDSWYPGWTATVDGNQAPIYRADLIFRAVPIGSGDHSVTLEYRPITFILGASITAGVAILLALLLVANR